MDHYGQVDASSTVYIYFTTHAQTGAAVAPSTAFEAADVRVYKNGSATQRASEVGYTMTSPFDTVTGLHLIAIDLSDNTDAGFYAAGSRYTVILVPDETVDSLAVVRVLADFTIGPAAADVEQWLGQAVATPTVNGVPEVDVTHWIGTAAATPTVAGVPEVDLTHVAGSTTSVSVLASNVATLIADIGGVATAAADGDPTGTDLLFAYIKQLVNVLVGSAGIVTWPTSAAPGNAVSIAEALRAIYDDTNELQVDDYPTSIAAIQADTDNIQTRIPAALVGGKMDSDMTAISGDTVAADNLENAFDDTVGGIRWTRIIDQGTAQAVTGTTIRLRAAAAFADSELVGCWVVITGGTTGVGQVRRITAYSSATDQATVDTWTTTPTGTITYQILPGAELTADVAKILGAAVSTSTAQLGVNAVQAGGTAWASGAITAAVFAANAINAAKLDADVATELNAGILAVLGALNDAAADGAVTTTDTMVAYLKQLINTLEGAPGMPTWPAAVAPGNGVSIAEALRYLYDQVGIAGAALTAADDAMITAIAAVQSDTDNIQTRLPAALVGGRMDSDVAVIQNGVITAAAIATGAIDADAVATDAVTELRSIVSGTADSGTNVTMVDAARTEADTDYWKDMAILFTSGTIAGQARLITAFDPATDTITFSPATTQAVGTNTYEIISNVAAAGASAPTAAEVADAVWDEDATAHQTGGTFGQAIGDPVADANTIYGAVVTGATGATVSADVVTLMAVLGALADAAADGDPTATDTAMAYLKQLVNVLVGTTGIVTFPAAASAANNVSLAEVIRAVAERLGTPSDLGGGATVAANLSDIEGQTDDIGIAGAGLTAVPWNAAWDAEVESEVNDALVVHRLDELLNADSDIDGVAPPTVGSVFHELMSKTAGSFSFDQLTDSLEAIRDRGDAAWITAVGFSTHSAADVWAVATRVLTAGTNIVLVKGVGVTGFNDLSAAAVNAEMVDVMATDVLTEPAQGAPPAAPTHREATAYLFYGLRNRVDIDTVSGYMEVYNDAGTVIYKKQLTDAGGILTEGEAVSGP